MIAGTSMLRTMKVSTSTPKDTTVPSSSRMSIGSMASTAKVPARMMPALVITGPVVTRARSAPRLVPIRLASSRTRSMRKML